MAGRFLTGLVAAVFLWGPNKRHGFITVTHSGFTNDNAGGQFAVFVVSNQWNRSITLDQTYWIRTPSTLNSRWHHRSSIGQFASKPADLPMGSSETVMIPVPTNQTPWCVYIFARCKKNTFKEWITKAVDQMNIPAVADRFRNDRHAVESNLVEP